MMIITDLWKYYGDQLILRDITAAIRPTDRIGLVGANGAGKTTLLKMLAGEVIPDQGRIDLRRGFTTGYLGQADLHVEQNLREFLQVPFAEQLALEEKMRALEKKMGRLAPGPALDGAMKSYAAAQAQFEHAGGYDYLVEISAVVSGLGFSEEDLSRRVDSFSGGEQMRLGLARLLLSKPSLLVLDEPTNHLDLEAVQWLETYLSGYPFAFIVASHDRFFLDKVAERIWQLENHLLYQYRGNYSQYLPQRRLRRARQLEKQQRQQEEKARMEAFIRKFGAGTRARQAKSIEKRMARLPELEGPASDPALAFQFEPRRQSGNDVVLLENVNKSFGDQQVLINITAQARRGERIALLGPNGSGKSTLLKLLSGELEYEGLIRWGAGVETGYFSQQISFTPGRTVLEELYAEHRLDLGTLRSVLARFLFRGEDVFKETGVLSGGERNRLALAKLLLHRPNLLLLDEPTNHLDIFAREALEEALINFGGTIIFVSHDRYLIDKLAAKVWYLESGSLQEFIGNFSQFETARRREVSRAGQEKAGRIQTQREKRSEKPKISFKAERLLVEEEIADLEAKKERLELLLASPGFYQDESKSSTAVRDYREINAELQRKYKIWEKLIDEQEGGGNSVRSKE